MKTNLILSILVVFAGCSRQDVSVVISCNSRKDYAKTVTEAQSKLIGTWRLTSDRGCGVRNEAIPVANIILTFSPAQAVSATIEGQKTNVVSYQLILNQAPYGKDSLTQLAIGQPLIMPNVPAYSMRNGVVYVCDEQLSIDYGSAVDLPVQEYSRVK